MQISLEELYESPELTIDAISGLHYKESSDYFELTSLDFDFRHGSIGNFYLSSTAQYFKSLEHALEQMRYFLTIIL